MRIGFDAKRLYHNNTGLGNYARTLVGDFSKQFPENEIHLFSPTTKNSPQTNPFLKAPFINHIAKNQIKSIWRTFQISKEAKRLGLDIYHGLSHELPIGIEKTKLKTVVTIHDLIFKIYPDLYPMIDRKVYDLKFESACRRADKIIAISESTKQDIIKYYQTPEEKIQVIHLSCNPIFFETVEESKRQAVLQKHDLPNEFLLYVGSIIERKNLLSVIQAMERLPEDLDIPLVVVGKGKTYLQKIKNYIKDKPIRNRVIFTKNVATEDLPALYQAAQIFLFPSVYEGFGIPILEALHSGTPVITCPYSSLPEVGGEAACYVEPNDIDDMAESITKILTDSHLRENMVLKGHEHAKRFEPKKLTRELMDLYRNL